MALKSGSSPHVLSLPTDEALRPYLDKEITLGIRPEALAIAAAGADHLLCQVDLVEPTGPDTSLQVQINGVRVTARVEPQNARAPGEAAALAFDMAKAVLFDPLSRGRIGR